MWWWCGGDGWKSGKRPGEKDQSQILPPQRPTPTLSSSLKNYSRRRPYTYVSDDRMAKASACVTIVCWGRLDGEKVVSRIRGKAEAHSQFYYSQLRTFPSLISPHNDARRRLLASIGDDTTETASACMFVESWRQLERKYRLPRSGADLKTITKITFRCPTRPLHSIYLGIFLVVALIALRMPLLYLIWLVLC